MQTNIIFGIVAIAILVIGAIFVSAQQDAPAEQAEEPEAQECGAEGGCGAGCDGSCGGGCGATKCGCGK